MKRTATLWQVVMIILLIGIVSCTSQTAVSPTLEPKDSPSVSITPVFPTPSDTLTKTPLVATLIVSTAITSQFFESSYASLPSNQYLISVERNDCKKNSNTIDCNDIRVMSVDGYINELLVEGLPGAGFFYRNGRLAFTKTYWDSIQQHNQIQVFSLINGMNSEIQNPTNKECMAKDWTLDGEQLIVLCRIRDDYRFFEIALLSIENKEFTTMLQDPNEEDASGGYEQLRLSRDGKWLAFYRVYAHGPQLIEGLYIMDMSCLLLPSSCEDKTYRLSFANLTSEYGNRILDWTVDGYLARAFDNKIELYDIQNNKIIRTITLASKGGQILEMSWSPDGRWVAIDQLDTPGAFLISTDDGEVIGLPVAIEDSFWLDIP